MREHGRRRRGHVPVGRGEASGRASAGRVRGARRVRHVRRRSWKRARRCFVVDRRGARAPEPGASRVPASDWPARRRSSGRPARAAARAGHGARDRDDRRDHQGLPQRVSPRCRSRGSSTTLVELEAAAAYRPQHDRRLPVHDLQKGADVMAGRAADARAASARRAARRAPRGSTPGGEETGAIRRRTRASRLRADDR